MFSKTIVAVALSISLAPSLLGLFGPLQSIGFILLQNVGRPRLKWQTPRPSVSLNPKSYALDLSLNPKHETLKPISAAPNEYFCIISTKNPANAHKYHWALRVPLS